MPPFVFNSRSALNPLLDSTFNLSAPVPKRCKCAPVGVVVPIPTFVASSKIWELPPVVELVNLMTYPVAPEMFAAPVAPVAPVTPVAPVGPTVPVAPVTPVVPVAPTPPVGPVEPVGPATDEVA